MYWIFSFSNKKSTQNNFSILLNKFIEINLYQFTKFFNPEFAVNILFLLENKKSSVIKSAIF